MIAISRELAGDCVRVAAFVMHAAMACVVASLLLACHTQVYTNRGYHIVTTDWQAYKLQGTQQTTCNSTLQCNRMAYGWIEDEPLQHHGWNPYATVMAFEFISASFAFFYLRELRHAPPALRVACRYVPHVWNLVGLAIYLAWFALRGMDNWCETLAIFVSYGLATVVLTGHDAWRKDFEETAVAGLASALARQYSCQVAGRLCRIPVRTGAEPGLLDEDTPTAARLAALLRQRLGVLTRYGEYTVTASLLYVAVLSIFVVGPPSWAFVAGFAGIFACNAMGLGLHLLHTELAVGPRIWEAVDAGGHSEPPVRSWYSPLLTVPIVCAPPVPPPIGVQPEARWHHTAAALFGVGTWHEHWVSRLEMLKGAWAGLMVGVTIVLYFGRGYLFNTSMPAFVLVTLWNLVITYAAFGFVATFFYVYDQYWAWLEPALDVLSVSAKVPIAMSVCVAFLQMPGGSC